MADWVKNRLTLLCDWKIAAQVLSDIAGQIEYDDKTVELVIDFGRIKPAPMETILGRGALFAYWGTTCYAFGQRRVDSNTIEFLTAWNDALGMMAALSAQYPGVRMKYTHSTMMTDHGWVCGSYKLLGGAILSASAPAEGTAGYDAISASFGAADELPEQADGHHSVAISGRKVDDRGLYLLDEDERLRAAIENLDISLRAYNCLKRAGIHTVADIVACSEGELAAVRNLNAACVAEIKAKIEGLGFCLAPS